MRFIILVILLFYLTYDSLSKAVGLWKKETIALEREAAAFKPLAGSQQELSAMLPEKATPSVQMKDGLLTDSKIDAAATAINHESIKSEKSASSEQN